MVREPICSVSLSLSRVFHLFCSGSLCVSPLSLYYVFHPSVPFSPLILMCFTIFSWCVSPSSLRFKRVEGGLWYPRLSTHGACSCYTTQLPSFYIAFAINLQSPIPWISNLISYTHTHAHIFLAKKNNAYILMDPPLTWFWLSWER